MNMAMAIMPTPAMMFPDDFVSESTNCFNSGVSSGPFLSVLPAKDHPYGTPCYAEQIAE